MTKDEFTHQNEFWLDVCYAYAIHKTDGGALYLYRVDFEDFEDNCVLDVEVFRLDGIDWNRFKKHVDLIIEA